MSHRREDHPVTEAASDELREWAKGTDFPDPVTWGEVEARIMRCLPPPRHEIEPWFSKDERLSSVIGYLMMAPVVIATVGAPVVGLGFAFAYSRFGWSPHGDWFVIVQILFLEAIVVPVIPLTMLRTSKSRERWHLPLICGAFVASSASYVLLRVTSRTNDWSVVALCALVAALVGGIAFVVHLLASKPGIRRPVRESWRAVAPEEQWYQAMRAGVLEVMAKRGLVERIHIPTMVEMPLGTWSELDDGPSGPR